MMAAIGFDSISGNLMEYTLLVISVLLFIYSIYTYFDQRRNLRFRAVKAMATPYLAVMLMIAGLVNYMYNGKKMIDACAAVILIVFALHMLLSCNGIGESGIYYEGMRISWKQVDKVILKEQNNSIQFICIRKNTE